MFSLSLSKNRLSQRMYFYMEEQILSCIDKALNKFGPSVQPVVYYRLQQEYGLRREDIPAHLDSFILLVDRFFDVGAHIVRASIMDEIGKAIEEESRKEKEGKQEGFDSSEELSLVMRRVRDQFASKTAAQRDQAAGLLAVKSSASKVKRNF